MPSRLAKAGLSLPDRLMAGQLILVQFVVVRIHLGQQTNESTPEGWIFYLQQTQACLQVAANKKYKRDSAVDSFVYSPPTHKDQRS